MDAVNLSNTLAQAAGVNESGQTVKGAIAISTSQSTSSTSYVTLATADQVQSLVVPANGLLRVWYRATWQESVVAGASAAIFIGSNQLKVADGATAPDLQSATTGGLGSANINVPLFSCAPGLASTSNTFNYTGDVSTGQAAAYVPLASANRPQMQVGSTTVPVPTFTPVGGPCDILGLAAGTYTVSVQFKVTSGSVTVANRLLACQVLSFS